MGITTSRKKKRNFIQLSHRKIDEDILTEMLQANEIIFFLFSCGVKLAGVLMSVVYFCIITLGDTVSLEHWILLEIQLLSP